ncbi:MAG: ABC transporter ATP-binding protein [Kofleriaceae bacterium]
MAERLPTLFLRYFQEYWRLAGARMLVLVGLTLVMAYAEGIGIALFFPLFSSDANMASAGFAGQIAGIFDSLGLAFEPVNVLPLIILLFVVKGALQFVTFRYQYSLTRFVTAKLRRRTLAALEAADYQKVSSKNAGFYSNLISNEVNRSANGFLYFVRSLSPALSGGMLFVMVWFLDWRLSLACVLMGLLMIGLTRISGMVIRRHSHSVTKETTALSGLLVQMVHAFKYLRATGAYKRFESRVWGTSERLLDADLRSATASSLLNSMSQPIMVIFLGGILYYQAVIKGGDLAPLFVLLIYFLRVMNEVFALQSSWQGFCGYLGSIELVRETTQEIEASAEKSGTEKFEQLDDAIVFDHVSFSYATGRVVLDDVSLRIAKHTTVAFVGESGAGKSTLVDLATGTLKATSGTVAIDGTSITDLDLSTLRDRVGYVPQDAVLFDDTVAQNIALWSDVHSSEDIRSAAESASCLDFIERMPKGFETEVGDRGVKLSGGQRQRLAIARELVRDPDILVLDEATSALDTESEVAIQKSIDQLKGRMTIMIIAHRLSTIRGCDRVYVISNGKIVEDGGFEELASRPGGRFRRMCELQELA